MRVCLFLPQALGPSFPLVPVLPPDTGVVLSVGRSPPAPRVPVHPQTQGFLFGSCLFSPRRWGLGDHRQVHDLAHARAHTLDTLPDPLQALSQLRLPDPPQALSLALPA